MARLIKADGTETELTPRGKRWSLDELQMAVGGNIEIMPGVKFRMVMHESAALRNMSVNEKATQIVLEGLKDKPLRYIPTIRGTVLILDPKEKM